MPAMSTTPENQTPSSQIQTDGPQAQATQIQADKPATSPLPDVQSQREPTARPVRLWPGLVLSVFGIVVFVLTYFLVDLFEATQEWSNSIVVLFSAALAPAACSIFLLIWWLFFSRQAWFTKGKVLALLALATTAVMFACEEGARFVVAMWGIPATTAVMVLYWAISSSTASRSRNIGLVLVTLASLLPWVAFRFQGSAGNALPNLTLRWNVTVRDVQEPDENVNLASIMLPKAETVREDWPGFRGPNRDAIIPNLTISPEFVTTPPKPLWKTDVGDGWSSCVIVGNLLYTQEQRNTEYEAVVCYDADNGEAIWIHKEKARFFESQGRAGPRATPTYEDGKLYVMGATGLLLCLDARDGSKKWGVNITDTIQAEVPTWGFSASPLVYKDTVYVQGGGKNNQPILLAFDKKTGDFKWGAGSGDTQYCSPVLMKLDGVEQIIMQSGSGITSHDPKSGDVLWKLKWGAPMPSSVVAMPCKVGPNSLVAAVGHGSGMKRLKVTKSGGKWNVETQWKTTRFDPRFNDFICHNGYLYGLSAGFLECYDLETGSRKWRGEKYGFGQLLLVGDKLLVVSEKRVFTAEKGFVVLVKADPSRFTPLGKFLAINGKAWNHPAIADNKLYLRTDKQMVCYPLMLGENAPDAKKE